MISNQSKKQSTLFAALPDYVSTPDLAPAVGLSVKLVTLLSEQTEAIGISEISKR